MQEQVLAALLLIQIRAEVWTFLGLITGRWTNAETSMRLN